MKLSTQAVRDRFIDEFKSEAAITQRVLKALPPKRAAYRPHKKSMNLGDLAWHIVTAESWFIGGMLRGSFDNGMPADVPKKAPKNFKAMAGVHKHLTAARVRELKRAKPAALAKRTNFFGMAKLPALEYMRWNISHTIHHRGQLCVYLRLVKAKVPSVYGPSADTGA